MKVCMDSILFIAKANNIKPRCEIVLYAKSLFILNCVKPKMVPIIRDNKELKSKLDLQLKLNGKYELLV